MKDDSPTKEEILKCLTRSGYLLESRLVATLENNEFFVEPNQVILDENTGKSRELDIIAEKSIHALTDVHRDVSVRSFFIIEAINNKYPLILTTLREYNSNKPFELGETYWATPDEVSNTPEIGTRIDPENNGLYSQYCSITRKKNKEGELMASHSDDLYNSFSKMTHYCTTQINNNYDRKLKEGIWLLWYWRPILVLQNELMVLDENENLEYSLRSVNKASLEFNFHDEGEQSSINIDIVVESCLLEHINNIIEQDESIKAKLSERRAKLSGHRYEET